MSSETPTEVAAPDVTPAPSDPVPVRPWWTRPARLAVLATVVAALAGGAWLVAGELETSRLQARYLARYASRLEHTLAAGASNAIRFPAHGPFDQRLGYTALPQFAQRLQKDGLVVNQQARLNEAALAHADRGLFLPFPEKSRAGLDVLDSRGRRLYGFRYPYRGYARFQDVPAVVMQSLLFIENRDLLDPSRPTMNPAVDWMRFGRAVLGQVGRVVDDDLDTPGGSTLATQIEKYRHSPNGITHEGREKLRQMASASVRAYRDGENTLGRRRQIVLDYLNTVPLSAAPRHGEVHGLGDGLWVWFGADFEKVNALLARPEAPGIDRAAQGRALRQVVALMIAHRRPSWYLAGGRKELSSATAAHLRLLAQAGVISSALRDAALAQPLAFRDLARNPPLHRSDPGKGTTAVRTRLASMLGTSLYSLDRLDAEMTTTLNGDLQETVTQFLGRLSDPAFAREQGLVGEKMLSPGRVGDVRYSFTLIERTPQGNQVRVQTDTTDQPLDINEGSKLELGSTAKLRVLATYLEMVAERHAALVGKTPAELRKLPVDPQDTLSRWVTDRLARPGDHSLPATLEAALERRFSASPGEGFFTGGGLHYFGNYNRDDDGRLPTLREAMQASINLPFVRLMREVVRHTIHDDPGSTASLLKDIRDPRREQYLARFADREGQTFLRRFWRKMDDQTADEMRAMLLDGLRPSAERLSAVFRYLEPEAPPEALGRFLAGRMGAAAPNEARVAALHERYAPEAFDLPDRGYVAGVHPLELWLVRYRLQHPQATLGDAIKASQAERQAVYGWLFRTRFKGAQDSRIYTMLEVEAFQEIHRRWTRLGYPFGYLVPSLATALGSSGDRPAALSALMGIIMNDGVSLPTRRIERVRFAAGTAYETVFGRQAPAGTRVMSADVARALQSALSDVVERGTARRLTGAFRTPDGQEIRLGGKTGTGDNRVRVQGRAGLALNRTATFVFSLGPRHFGTITAYVVGQGADKHKFTSALPVQILRSMGPVLAPHLGGGAPAVRAGPAVPAAAASASASASAAAAAAATAATPAASGPRPAKPAHPTQPAQPAQAAESQPS